ncbi:MAG: helix-turn-helix transcriptional regulator [Clostridia bacterium]|nr:helix-turn-helix transcriptional regulator [Clostridia bacterium]
MLHSILKEKSMTIYQCAKLSGVPYTTLSELIRGKTRMEKCSAETVYRLSRVLHVSMDYLMQDTIEPRSDFEIFKSNMCHRIKDTDDLDFIIDTLKSNDIRSYWNKKWYPEAFYLLAAVDYLSRIHKIPLCSQYDDIRLYSLKSPLYPRDVQMSSQLDRNSESKERCRRDAIPEFSRFNIMESEIRNVY